MTKQLPHRAYDDYGTGYDAWHELAMTQSMRKLKAVLREIIAQEYTDWNKGYLRAVFDAVEKRGSTKLKEELVAYRARRRLEI